MLLEKKYLAILKDISTIKILKLNIPAGYAILGFFLLESAVFLLSDFIGSINLVVLSINTKALVSLPIWSILIINGLVISLFVFVMARNINRRAYSRSMEIATLFESKSFYIEEDVIPFKELYPLIKKYFTDFCNEAGIGYDGERGDNI